MKTTLLAGVAAATLAAAAPAFAGGNSHHWHNGGGGWNHHHGGGWGWGAPLLGSLAGAAIVGSVLAAPYYGYGGYRYAPYYTYPTPFVPPQPRWCPGQYGGWFQC
jgi:hypothetical protein